MNKKKFTLCIFSALCISFTKAQTGINTNQPKAGLHVEKINNVALPDGLIIPRYTVSELAAKDTAYGTDQNGTLIFITSGTGTAGKTIDITGTGLYYYDNATSKWKTFYGSSNGITQTGSNFKLGGSLSQPTTIGTTAANTLSLNGLQASTELDDYFVVADPTTGVLKTQTSDKLGIPRPAVFQLDADITDFLQGVGSGGKRNVAMGIVANNTGANGITFNSTTNTITFKPGLYQITFVYEALHDATGCKLSSYFVDFPKGTGTTTQRIHSTAGHVEGGLASHGGTITYTTRITGTYNWVIQLGRGQSGDSGCTATAGMKLIKESTQVSILKVGN